MEHQVYDCAIIGGGVAGLTLATQMAREGRSTILFEKETYPFHKVCGEYISNESLPFLKTLGLDLTKQALPKITGLFLSSPKGISIQRPLDIGGTGLSRYSLDLQLYELALKAGAIVRTGSKVRQVDFTNGIFKISDGKNEVFSKTVAGAYGKNANLDVELGRNYKTTDNKHLFVAVKHHIRTEFNSSQVEMHNFPGGYCGLSAIEEGKVNLSYISLASNLKKSGSISNMEKQILSKNPYLKKHFENAEFLFEKPLTISHLYFEIKTPVTQHILMLGDAAGNIAPLSGNGMSMAFQSAKLAKQCISEYLDNKISYLELENKYRAAYKSTFANRIQNARLINSTFGSPIFTDLGFRFLKLFPSLVDSMSRRIHGQEF